MTCLLVVLLAAVSATAQQPQASSVALQPFGNPSTSMVHAVRSGIADIYGNVSITVLPTMELPDSAYYAPRQRYRATKLIAHVEATKADEFSKIIGLTTNDISITRGEEYDSGIIAASGTGLDSIVISTFRIHTGNPSPELFLRRLRAITRHELGHSLGLPHCKTKGCLMEDLKGRIATIDNGSWQFCPQCKKYLEKLTGNEIIANPGVQSTRQRPRD